MRPKACSRLTTPFFSSLVVSSLVASGSEPRFSALDLTSCSGPTFAEIFYSIISELSCHLSATMSVFLLWTFLVMKFSHVVAHKQNVSHTVLARINLCLKRSSGKVL